MDARERLLYSASDYERRLEVDQSLLSDALKHRTWIIAIASTILAAALAGKWEAALAVAGEWDAPCARLVLGWMVGVGSLCLAASIYLGALVRQDLLAQARERVELLHLAALQTAYVRTGTDSPPYRTASEARERVEDGRELRLSSEVERFAKHKATLDANEALVGKRGSRQDRLVVFGALLVMLVRGVSVVASIVASEGP